MNHQTKPNHFTEAIPEVPSTYLFVANADQLRTQSEKLWRSRRSRPWVEIKWSWRQTQVQMGIVCFCHQNVSANLRRNFTAEDLKASADNWVCVLRFSIFSRHFNVSSPAAGEISCNVALKRLKLSVIRLTLNVFLLLGERQSSRVRTGSLLRKIFFKLWKREIRSKSSLPLSLHCAKIKERRTGRSCAINWFPSFGIKCEKRRNDYNLEFHKKSRRSFMKKLLFKFHFYHYFFQPTRWTFSLLEKPRRTRKIIS